MASRRPRRYEGGQSGLGDDIATLTWLTRDDDLKRPGARGIIGDGAEPFEAQFRDGTWTICLASRARDQRIIQLHCEGLNQRDIAKEADTSAATVNRVIKRYKSGASAADNDG